MNMEMVHRQNHQHYIEEGLHNRCLRRCRRSHQFQGKQEDHEQRGPLAYGEEEVEEVVEMMTQGYS